MSNIEKVLADFKAGRFVIVTDDVSRENEADLIVLGEKVTSEQMAFMVRHTSGVICGVINSDIARKLKLPFMVKRNEDSHGTAFTVSIDAIAGNTTGISAQERGNTLRAMANPNTLATDFARPGHIFPLVAVDGGLHERRGHTEAGIALCLLTDSYPVAVISEIVNDDGTMLRGAQIKEFADKYGIEITTIDELAKIAPIQKSSQGAGFEWADLPMRNKTWKISTYRSPQGAEHAILKFSDLDSDRTLLRIHSECLTGDVFGSQRCDCGIQLSQAMTAIEENGSGLIIYMRDHEGRGIGLAEKIRAYVLQDQGQNTIEANLSLGQPVDDRNYNDAVEILKRLNISAVELITHNPEKISSLISAGIDVKVTSIPTAANEFNRKYLETKRDLLGHALGDI